MAIRLTASSSQYLEASGGPDFTSDYTVCGWVRFITLPTLETFAEMCVVEVCDGSFPQSFDRIGMWGPFTRNRWTVSTQTAASSSDFDTETTAATPATGVNYHVAMVRSGDDVRLYVDGVLEITSTNSAAARGGTDYTYLGTHNDTGTKTNFADAEFEGWKAYDRALTAAEILTEARTLAPTSWRGLHAAWPLVAGAGRRRDILTGARDFTEVGSPTDAASRRGLGLPAMTVGIGSAAAPSTIFTSPMQNLQRGGHSNRAARLAGILQ